MITNIFDWKFYLDYNSDILKHYDSNEENALEHYNNYGKDEKRIICEQMLYQIYEGLI